MCVCENYEFGFLQVEKVYMKTWMLELHMRSTKNHENNVCFIVLTKVACLVCYDGFVAMTLLSLFR